MCWALGVRRSIDLCRLVGFVLAVIFCMILNGDIVIGIIRTNYMVSKNRGIHSRLFTDQVDSRVNPVPTRDS